VAKQRTDATVNEDVQEVVADRQAVESGEVEIVDDGASEVPANDSTDAAALEMDALKQQLLRTSADFDNFRRRTRQEKEDLQKFANRKLLGDLLPVVDNFERAIQSFDATASDEIKTGVEMVYRQLASILQQNGAEEIAALGEPFDPNVHDAVMQEPADDGAAGVVSGVLQKGYILHGKVLRPAMVKVTV